MERPKFVDIKTPVAVNAEIQGPAIAVLQDPNVRFHALMKGQEIIEQTQINSLGVPPEKFESEADNTALQIVDLNRKVRREFVKTTGTCDVSSTGPIARAVNLLEVATLYAQGEAIKPVPALARYDKEAKKWNLLQRSYEPATFYQADSEDK